VSLVQLAAPDFGHRHNTDVDPGENTVVMPNARSCCRASVVSRLHAMAGVSGLATYREEFNAVA
jgi:hypothetical protein